MNNNIMATPKIGGGGLTVEVDLLITVQPN